MPQHSCMVLGEQPGLVVPGCLLYTEILPPCEAWDADMAGEGPQVKVTGCCSERYSAITDSVFPCSIRKTISGSCTRGKESNPIEINPFTLHLNATENRDVGGKQAKRPSAGARAGVLPAPLFLLQQCKRVCKLSAGSPQALRQTALCISLVFPQPDRMWSLQGSQKSAPNTLLSLLPLCLHS